MIKKELFLTIILIFLLPLLVVPLTIPVEGGLFIIIIGIMLLAAQLWSQTVISISKAFFVFVGVALYLWVFSIFARPIPITEIILQRVFVILMLAVFMYISLRQEIDRKPWENALITLAVVVSLVSLWEVFRWQKNYSAAAAALQVIPKPQIAYRIKGIFFGHPNPLAGFLNFVWPIVFIRYFNSKKPLLRYIWIILLLIFAVVILYTNSRGAVLGTLAGGAFIVLAFLFMKEFGFGRITPLFAQYKKQMAAVLGVLTLLVGGVLWRSIYTGQFSQISFSGRGTIWKYSWQAIHESPLFGQGMGAFPIPYTKFAQLPPGDFAPSAHNLWLQLGVDYGLLGLVFGLGLTGLFLYYGVKTLRSQSTEQLSFSVAYTAGGIAFLTQHTVDFMLVTLPYLIFFLVILVFILKYVVKAGEWSLNRRSFGLIGVAIIGILLITQGLVSAQVMSNSDYEEQRELAQSEQWELLQEKVCLSAEKYPRNALYKFECSLALVRLIDSQGQIDPLHYDSEALDQAIHYQGAGYDLNPYWAVQQANLAILYWEKGDQTRAIDLMEQAVRSAPVFDLLLLNAGWMEEQVGNQQAAVDYYIQALRLNPLINLSEFRQHSALFDIAAQDLISWGESEELWDSWYDTSRHDRGRLVNDREYWKGIIALSSGQSQLAVNHFENRINASGIGNPSPNLYFYLAYAYQINGQPEDVYALAQDVALLISRGVWRVSDSQRLSIIASILHDQGEDELAYRLMLRGFRNDQTRIYQRYFPAIYTQQILVSDISPWMIRNQTMLIDTKESWTWLIEETLRRGDIPLANKISLWQESLGGIANR